MAKPKRKHPPAKTAKRWFKSQNSPGPPRNASASGFGSSATQLLRAQAKGRKKDFSSEFQSAYHRGILGKDAQTKVLKNGTTVVNFSVATKRSWKDSNDEWKEKTMWHQVVCYGDGFAALAERLLSGTHVLVQGELTTRDYDRTIQVKAPNGKPFDHTIKQTVVELKADTIRILDRKREADDPQTGEPDEPQTTAEPEAA